MAAETASSTDLSVTVSEPSAASRRLSIVVPGERVQRIRRSVAVQYARNVRLPGFRKGKIPERLVEQQFGPAIEQQTVEKVIQETYREALDSQGLQPINQGEVQNLHYHGHGGELHYDVEFQVQPELRLARTGGFVVPRPTEQVGDDEVDAVLERLRAERATLHPVEEGNPDYNDEVMVEITALDQEGAEPQPYRFALGEGQAIEPIERSIMQLTPGEEREFDVTFPDDYVEEELRGQTQRMRIRLDELRRRELPALDDEFARAVGDFESMDAFRARVRADLHEEARRRAERGVREALVGQIVEANPIEVPDSMVERYLDFMMGLDPDQKRPEPAGEQAERISQLRQMLRPQAEAALKRILVIEHLADREGLRATQDEVDERVEKIAEAQGRTPSDVWLELENRGRLQGLEAEITEDKVFDWLRQQNTLG